MNFEENIELEDKKYLDTRLIKRLLKYAKPFFLLLILSLALMILITFLQLVRPVIIGKAIDFFINGYKTPYTILLKKAKDSIYFNGMHLIKEDKNRDNLPKAVIVYIKNRYYFIKDLSSDDIRNISTFDFSKQQTEAVILNITINAKAYNVELLSENDLKTLRFNDFRGIIFVTLLFLVVLIFGFVFNYFQTILLEFTGQKIIYNMRSEIFDHILRLPFKFFDTNPVGRLVTRVTNDTEAINEMYTSVLVNLFKNVMLMIGIIVMMLTINTVLSIITFIVLPFIIIAVLIFRNFARDNYRKMRKTLAALNAFLSEHISGMKIIQLFNVQEKKLKEFEKSSSNLNKTYMKEIKLFGIFRPLMFVFYIIGVCLVLLFGGNYVILGVMSFGTLFMFFYYVGLFFEPIQELAEQFNILQSAVASSERIFKLLDESIEIQSNFRSIELKQVAGKIEFKNVWFAYNDEDWVLKDISFTINPGETAAVVGFTGSGKTTLINLICRFYEIQKGEILIDGINIKNIETASLRKNIGVVMQEVFIFTGTIESNIRLKDSDISQEEVINASRFVNANSFIDKLDKKYDHTVSERGSTLSTGQRQLLSFARTLCFKPAIMVLDEATSNIDTETEILIQEALSNMISNRTSIVIAHRLSTIQHSQKIIVIHKGEIKEIGTHKNLIQKKGIYYNLYRLNYGLN